MRYQDHQDVLRWSSRQGNDRIAGFGVVRRVGRFDTPYRDPVSVHDHNDYNEKLVYILFHTGLLYAQSLLIS